MRLLLWFYVGIHVAAHAVAQDPTVDRAESTNLRPGESAEVRVYGTNLKSLQTLWTTFGELKPAPPAEKPNDKLAVFTGLIPSETVPGMYPYRIVAANGCSLIQYFVVDDLPNAVLEAASETPLPLTEVPTACCIQGAVNSIKPRYFGVKLEAGQKLSVEVYARRLNSALDPVLKITSPDGHEIAFRDDQPGLSGDAQLQFTADDTGSKDAQLAATLPDAGEYFVAVRELSGLAGPDWTYDLEVQRSTGRADTTFATDHFVLPKAPWQFR